MVKITAPALSDVVIFFVTPVGVALVPDPADGSPFDVPPVSFVTGAIAPVICVVPRTESALIYENGCVSIENAKGHVWN